LTGRIAHFVVAVRCCSVDREWSNIVELVCDVHQQLIGGCAGLLVDLEDNTVKQWQWFVISVCSAQHTSVAV
jgi:hypothetical protein